MRTLKKVLAVVLALAMVLGMAVTASAGYDDAAAITDKEAVEVLGALGVMVGSGNKFNPAGTLTRAEAAVLIAKLCLGEDAEDLTAVQMFSDVDATNWAAKYVAYCATKGIVAGVGNGKFNPTGKLTGTEFALMLLATLGYDAKIELTGANWAEKTVQIAALAKKAGLTSKSLKTTEITREEAAKLCFKALKADCVKYETKGTTITVGGVEIVTGASKATAVNDANAGEIWGEDDATQLAEALYGSDLVYEKSVADKFGRPAHSWKYDDFTGEYAAEADMIYTEGFDADELQKLLDDGYTFNNVEVFVNGVKDASLTVNATRVNDSTDIEDRDYVGTVVELYDTNKSAKSIERIVLVQPYLAKVTAEQTGRTTKTNNYITFEVYNPWASQEKVTGIKFQDDTKTKESKFDKLSAKFDKDDYAILYFKGADVSAANYLSNAAPEKVTATVSSMTISVANGYNGKFVAGGETYKLASAYAEKTLPIANKTEYDFYLDENGYVLGAVATEETGTAWNYGVVLNYATHDVVSEVEVDGTKAKAAYENFQIYTSNNEVKLFSTSFKTDSDGAFKDAANNPGAKAGFTNDAPGNGTLVLYKTNAAGKITEIYKATDNSSITSHTKGDAFIVNGSEYATNKTVVFVKTDAAPMTKKTVKAYTGYKNLPSATYVVETNNVFKADTDKKVGSAMLISAGATLPDAKSDAVYAVITSAATSIVDENDDTKVSYTAIVNGEEKEIYFLNPTGSDAVMDKNAVYKIEFVSGTDEVSTKAEQTSLKEITTVGAGFYVLNDVSGAIYTDDDTVFYELSRNAAGKYTDMTVVEGLPETSADYDIYQLDAPVVANTASTAVDAVLFYVADVVDN